MQSRSWLVAACLILACDKGDKTPSEPPASAAPSESVATPEPIDVSADKSGALARAAAVLEVDGIDSEDLRGLSHHAEKLPSASVLCKHMTEVRQSTGGIKDCVEMVEHQVAQLGPELYAAAAECFMAAQTVAELDACAQAEAEAEKLLHDQPHGEGLDEATCQGFFVKFEELAMADAKDDAEHVKQVLDTVRGDLVRSCMEHSTQAEMDCANKAATLHELEQCAADLV